jgi:hypothetical protein
MTPEERRAYIIDLARVREEAIREAYEDAARIAIDSTIETAVAVVGRDIAAAIRARIND